MNIISQQDRQMELFPEDEQSKKRRHTDHISGLFITTENVIVLGIIFLVSVVIFFALGVERGKSIAYIDQASEEKGDNQKSHAIISDSLAQGAAVTTPPVTRQPLATQPQNTLNLTRVSPQAQSVVPIPQPVRISTPAPEADASRVEVLHLPEEQINSLVEPKYTVQVASFKRDLNARQESEKIRRKGIKADTFVIRKGDYYIVCVGRFQEKDEAKTFSNKLIKDYKDLLVRRL